MNNKENKIFCILIIMWIIVVCCSLIFSFTQIYYQTKAIDAGVAHFVFTDKYSKTGEFQFITNYNNLTNNLTNN